MALSCDCITLTGTHGTSMSRALSIVNLKKFTPSPEGLGGYGVYFWEVSGSLDFSKKLAQNWWRFASSPKYDVYKDDEDKSLAVLKAKIIPFEREFFDATDDEFLLACSQIAEEKMLFQKEDIIKLRTAVLMDIEKEMGVNFSVVKIDVEVPGKQKGESYAPSFYWLKKQAGCYVVKNKIDEVIQEIELVEV